MISSGIVQHGISKTHLLGYEVAMKLKFKAIPIKIEGDVFLFDFKVYDFCCSTILYPELTLTNIVYLNPVKQGLSFALQLTLSL